MSDERDGDPRQPAVRRWLAHARRLARRAARPRLVTATGLPAALALSGAIPLIIGQSASARPAPSTMLCTGWHRCDARGYDSYGYGAHDGAMYWRMFPGDNCTNYVAYVESRVYHVATPRYLLGDGGQWALVARSHGVLVNHTPTVGAVAEWNGGSAGIGGAGHVAVVEEVGPRRRYIVISQQNMSADRDGYDWTLIRAGYPSDEWQEWPSNFIHFRIPRHADVGYYSARSRAISVRDSLTSGPANSTVRIGGGGVIPLVGDWSGRGTDNVGYYNPKSGTFHLTGVNRSAHPNLTFKFGPPGMIPLIGDWKGIGRDGVGYYNPRTATFYLRESLTSGRPDVSFRFGPPGMIPLAGDWNGGRRDGVGFYDPRTGIFRLRNRLAPGPLYRSFRFGPPHMIPLSGNWLGGRKDSVGYYNRWTGVFFLRDRLSNGPASYVVRFGPRLMVPRAGDWFGG
ncbi:MAG TPA: CHAP domain-containing protein [Streptosporangiaceae bacterium]|nr:CHAP domain-containing protein [Streptosporangiaceae bacterium]